MTNNTELGKTGEKEGGKLEKDVFIDGAPVCKQCGNVKIEEDGEWVCPHCQGEINFLGDEDE